MRKDQAGKTPVNHSTVSSQGSRTLGSTPMVQNLSQTGLTVSSSPGGGGGLGGSFGGTPLAGLGVDLNGGMGTGATTGGSNGTPTTNQLSAALMTTSISEFARNYNLHQPPKRNEDEERRLKIRRILKTIGTPTGRVGEEGIARVSRRIGFQNDIDAEKLTAEEKARKVGNRTISIAGKTILVDVELRDHIARSVQVDFSGTSDALAEHGSLAGKVLWRDLQPSNGIAINASLDRFAQNLERLARMDRLSERVNCFEAVGGLYTSLRRLFEMEKKAAHAAKVVDDDNDFQAEMEVLRKRSGRPMIHAGDTIGLSLDYWTVHEPKPKRRNDDSMDVDSNGKMEETTGDGDSSDVFSLRIEVEASSAELYPSLRVSHAWLPETFELHSAESGQGIPWQDPPPTYISSDNTTSSTDAMAIDETSKLPDLRFVAKLDPPLICPSQALTDIYPVLGFGMPNYLTEFYHASLLNIPPGAVQAGLEVTMDRNVLTVKDGQEVNVTHHYVLELSKSEGGDTIHSLPFSHPRQIIGLLPVLRQWAHYTALVRQAFTTNPVYSSDQEITTKGTKSSNGTNKARISLNDILHNAQNTDREPPRATDTLPVNVSLYPSSRPSLSFTFPNRTTSSVDNVTVEILPNAEIAIVDKERMDVNGNGNGNGNGNVSEEDKDEDETDTGTNGEMQSEKFKRLAKALTVCADVGVWIEWMRRDQS